ncbi:MAG: methyltransferase domain-containing protein [Lachnospiraceae bacterium]|nr:methyltransferase domain-containing protein [Lachnospiraceae bacterium]
MYQNVVDLINNGEWNQAEIKLQEKIGDNGWCDEAYILAATIYMETGENEQAYDVISQGLQYNYRNYELYLLLGNYYESINVNQAWLCYENAEFYCDNDADKETILQYKDNIERNAEWNVKKTAIVIASYDQAELMKQCIISIRENNLASSYEMIVVDNHSTDGITEWLCAQEDIKLICNKENKGFPYACNQGIKIAEPESDIFLLNNDTIVTPNAIFWLRMGLYSGNRVGAAGSITNHAGNNQRIEEEFETVEEYLQFAKTNNIPMKNPYEKKIYLIGFALLLKREALDETGLLDVRFTPGCFEDNDLGIRLHLAGYQVYLCQNSFIYHYGHGDGINSHTWDSVMEINKDKLKEKWKLDVCYYSYARIDLINLMKEKHDEKISVLEIGCGLGATLARIEYLWPKAEAKGIELVERLVDIGANYLDIIQGNIETMEIPYETKSFDYIILVDVLEHLYDPTKCLKRLVPYLKDDGFILCSIPNIMHMSVIVSLLRGKFEYQDKGILDRTHLRFFTLESIIKMLWECGLRIEHLSGVFQETQEKDIMDEILHLNIPNVATENQFQVFQYILKVKKHNDELDSAQTQ